MIPCTIDAACRMAVVVLGESVAAAPLFACLEILPHLDTRLIIIVFTVLTPQNVLPFHDFITLAYSCQTEIPHGNGHFAKSL
jgi:hypothetical protein